MALTRGLALALTSAALISAAGRPWAPGWLALIALVPLLVALVDEHHAPRGALFGWLAAWGTGLTAFEGVAPAALWVYPGLVALSAVPFALAGAGTVAIGRRLGAGAAVAAFVPLVLASEFVSAQRWLLGDYANVFTALGYTQFDTPLRAAAAWSGISTVSLLVLAANAAVYALVMWRRPLPAVTVAAGIIAVALLSAPGRDVAAATTEPLRVAIVQGAVTSIDSLMARFDRASAVRMVAPYGELTATAAARGAELVIWGETALPQPVRPGHVPGYVAAALAPAPLALVGAVSYVGGRSYNAVFHWQDGALLEVYRKRALVPVNERQYSRGEALPPLDVRGVPVGLGVCLDSLVPSLAREAVRAGSQLLVYVTEDAFAGQTVTPELHLRATAFRAIETGRAVVFASQSGPSAAIDPAGRVVERLPQGVPAGLVVDVQARAGITPFVHFGDWVGGLASAVSALFLAHAMTRTAR